MRSFVSSSVDSVAAQLPRFEVRRSYKYGRKGFQIDTPDLLISDGGKLVVVAECKATKLTYLAQFAEDPFEAEQRQYNQIAKAVFQVWRFFSHIRRGLVTEQLSDDVCGMIIMLDPFLSMSRELKTQIMERAAVLAVEDADILDEDRRYIVFCPMHDLEAVLQVGTEDTLLGALKASRDERFNGWELHSAHRDFAPQREKEPHKPYPFELDDLLPWWKQSRKYGEGMKQAAVPKVVPHAEG